MRNCSNSEQFLGLQTGLWVREQHSPGMVCHPENASIFSWNCFHFPTDWNSDYSGHLHDRALNWHLPLACLPWTWLVNHYFCLTWIESHLILFSRMFLMYEYCRVSLHFGLLLTTVNNQLKANFVCCSFFGFGDRNLNCGTVSVWQHCRVIGR